jgi:anaerobic selenocysteine-containing dehydrogenase
MRDERRGDPLAPPAGCHASTFEPRFGRRYDRELPHPDDAARTGVADGNLARVSSEAGTIEVPVEVSDEMMRGVVSLPHGWGHDKEGTRMSVAREHAGVNNNLLAPGRLVDPLSNNAVVNGIPVEVVPA